jgi:phosphotransferase system HPr (HPr) family protein
LTAAGPDPSGAADRHRPGNAFPVCDTEPTVTYEVEITNMHGLHLRPVMKFVDVANQFVADVRVDKGNGSERVDGKSPMAMMILEAPKGTVLRIHASGADAVQSAEALVALVRQKFDEE